jgi:hypothetical protein
MFGCEEKMRREKDVRESERREKMVRSRFEKLFVTIEKGEK